MFTIERVRQDTVPDFIFLLDQLAGYEHLQPPGADARTRLMTDILQNPPKFEAYIGRLGDEPVACVTFYFTYSTFRALPILFIEDLFVLEKYRRRGFGKQLFDFCRSEALTRGCGCMDWMVLRWNVPSIRFYEKIGAERRQWYTYRLGKDRL